MGFLSEKNLSGKGVRPAIVASRFHEPIVERLVEGAVQGFVQHEVNRGKIGIFWVPGAFEIPLVAKKLALTKHYHCIVCVGCVVKGETFHFDRLAHGVASGIMQAMLESGVPIIFSVVLSDDPQAAWERAGGRMGNRGFDGALAALEMANLLRSLKSRK